MTTANEALTARAQVELPAMPSPLQCVLAKGRVRAAMSMMGPAFVAAIAYVDPGNFATNFQGGASLGYELVWVVALANVIAMPIQYLSAKLGIVTGKSLPQLCGERLPTTAAILLWSQAEAVAMATDLAEFVGAAIGLNLLFRMPLPLAGVLTAIISFAILALQRHGHRRFELVIAGLLALICVGFLYETLRIGPSAQSTLGGLLPSLHGQSALLLSSGIIGATVMPHAIYLHSGLMSDRVPTRDPEEQRRLLRFERNDVGVALGVAGLVNLAMLVISAKLFARFDGSQLSLAGIHDDLGVLVGSGAALAFAVALLASGLSSSSVGTYAGQVIMDGFIHHQLPVVVRRGITMLPALALLFAHVDLIHTLIMSQVVLSVGIPFALIPLVILTSRRDLMGQHVNATSTTLGLGAVAAALCILNGWLVVNQLRG